MTDTVTADRDIFKFGPGNELAAGVYELWPGANLLHSVAVQAAKDAVTRMAPPASPGTQAQWPRDAGSRVPADAAALFSFKFVTPAARCSSQVAALARRPGPARGRRTVTHDPATTVTVTVTCQWPGPGRVPPTAGVTADRRCPADAGSQGGPGARAGGGRPAKSAQCQLEGRPFTA